MADMPVHTISIDLPNDVFLALNETETELKQRVRIALAVQLYKLQKLAIGKAAQLAGLSRLRSRTCFRTMPSPSQTSPWMM